MFRFTRKYYYINLEFGYIVTFDEMIAEAEELYDFDDYTNALELIEYYDLTDIPVDPD